LAVVRGASGRGRNVPLAGFPTGAFAGGAAQGAIAMAAFGAGTLPWLLAAALFSGVAAARLRRWSGLPRLRRAGGILLVGLGAWGLAHGVEQTLLCL